MAGSLEVGTLYVRVAADVSRFSKGMQKVTAEIERTARKVQQFTREIGMVGLGIAAGLGAAIREAAKFDVSIHRSLDRVKNEFATLTVELGRLFAPMLRQVANGISVLVERFRALSPATRASILHWAEIGLKVTVAALAISKASSIIAGAVSMLGVMLTALKGIAAVAATAVSPVAALGAAIKAAFTLGPLVLFLAALYGIIAGFGALKIAVAAMNETADTRASAGRQDRISNAREAVMRERNALPQVQADAFRRIYGAEGPAAERRFQRHMDLATRDDGMGRIDPAMLDPQDRLVQRQVDLQKARIAAAEAELAAAVADSKAKGFTAKQNEPDSEFLQRLAKEGPLGAIHESFKNGIKPIVDLVDGLNADLDKAAQHSKLKTPQEQILNFGTGFGPIADIANPAQQVRDADLEKDLARERVKSLLNSFDPVQRAAVEFARDIRGMGEVGEIFVERISGALNSLRDKAVGRMGALPGVIESGVQGAAIGGPVGAIGAVLLDLLSSSKQFAAWFEGIGEILQALADALGVLYEPILPLLDVLAPLALAVGVLAQVLSGALQPAFAILFEVIKSLTAGILFVALGIGEVWNGILWAIQSVFRLIGSIEVFGAKPFGFLNDWANSIENAKADTEGLHGAIDELGKATYDTSFKTHKLGKAAQDATEALSNVPEGFKVALARFNAADPESPAPAGGGGPTSGGAGGGAAPSPAPAPGTGPSGSPRGGAGGGGFGGPPIVMNISGAGDPEEVARRVAEKLKGIDFRRNRTPTSLSPRLA